MPSDRARVSYDEARQWRSVIPQQGRVGLEADENEAWQIAGDEQRKELIELVAPLGTPDDGFEVIETGTTTTPAFDVRVGAGTMYVGGMRVESPDEIVYSDQDEWLDRIGDPDWRDPTSAAGNKPYELVCLFLAEHEVGAVEDPALREVALGGPDTAQRTRLVMRIKRIGVNGSTCQAAIKEARSAWRVQGLQSDPETLRLEPAATLKVGFATATGTTGPCDPVATGGYLDADNQLIRVQITQWNDAAGTGRLLWGYDNSSFVYRAAVVNSQLLQLAQRPPDDAHQPRSGDAIEVLRAAVRLDADAFVAAPTGAVVTLARSYVPETQRIELPSPGLGSLYPASTNAKPPYFVRVWKQELAFTAGAPVTLGATGVTVTIDRGALPIFPGTSWCFAVRPSTPSAVYPERFLKAGQPAIGPRLWACPLAVVRWQAGVMTVVADCREHFDDLVTLTRRPTDIGCDCTACVSPTSHDTGTLTIQAAVDRVAATGGTVCLAPGRYVVEAPVRIDKARGVRVRGQGWRTEIVQSTLNAAIEVTNSAGVAIERLMVRALGDGSGPTRLAVPSGGLVAPTGVAGMGILIRNCAGVDVTDCAIVHAPVRDPGSLLEPDIELVEGLARDSDGVGIGLSSLALGHRLARNVIAARAAIGPVATGEGDERPSFDYLAMGRLLVEDNVMVCNRYGVRLEGHAMFLDATRVSGNTVYGCWEGAAVEAVGRIGLPDKPAGNVSVRVPIRAAGPADAASGLDVTGNVVWTAGDGVVSAVSGTRVTGNRIRALPDALPGRGVALVRTDDAPAVELAEIRGNRIDGMRGQGILADTALQVCNVAANTIEDVLSAAVAVSPDGRVERLTISDNEIARVMTLDPDAPTAVSGILAQAVTHLVADGNSVTHIGIGTEATFERTGIKLIAVTTARISGNRVESLGDKDYGGEGVGIDVAAPWDRLIISANTVARGRAAESRPTNSYFIAIRIRGTQKREPGDGEESGEIIELEPFFIEYVPIVIHVGDPPVVTPLEAEAPVAESFAATAATADPGGAASAAGRIVSVGTTSTLFPVGVLIGNASIDVVPGGRGVVNAAGNVLDADTDLRQRAPLGACFEIDAAGPCVLSNNHCIVSQASTAPAVARVDAESLVASANHLEGAAESLRMENVATFTALGNIAPGGISRSPGGVDQKWLDLNAT